MSGFVILFTHIGTCCPAQVKWTSPSSFGKISRQPGTAPSAIMLIFLRQRREQHRPAENPLLWRGQGEEAVTIFALISSGSEAAYPVCAFRVSTAKNPRLTPQSHPTAASVYASLRCDAGCGPVMVFAIEATIHAGAKKPRQPLVPAGIGRHHSETLLIRLPPCIALAAARRSAKRYTLIRSPASADPLPPACPACTRTHPRLRAVYLHPPANTIDTFSKVK